MEKMNNKINKIVKPILFLDKRSEYKKEIKMMFFLYFLRLFFSEIFWLHALFAVRYCTIGIILYLLNS